MAAVERGGVRARRCRARRCLRACGCNENGSARRPDKDPCVAWYWTCVADASPMRRASSLDIRRRAFRRGPKRLAVAAVAVAIAAHENADAPCEHGAPLCAPRATWSASPLHRAAATRLRLLRATKAPWRAFRCRAMHRRCAERRLWASGAALFNSLDSKARRASPRVPLRGKQVGGSARQYFLALGWHSSGPDGSSGNARMERAGPRTVTLVAVYRERVVFIVPGGGLPSPRPPVPSCRGWGTHSKRSHRRGQD